MSIQSESAANGTWCKICGVTNADDAVMVAQAGADAIGVNFYPASKRYVSIEEADKICVSVELIRVGVFVDADPEQVKRTLDAVDLDMLQFHGDESARYCEQFHLPYLKAVRMKSAASFGTSAQEHVNAWGFLLDTFVEGMPGGTGKQFDLSLWPQRSAEDAHQRLILAGGLTVNNVRASVQAVGPFGVDVAGGVECDSRNKDLRLVSQFISNLNQVERA